MDTSQQGEGLIVGKDIPWKAIEGEACRVKSFLPLGEVEAGKIRETIDFLPYALLGIECPKLSHEALMPVIHKEDFQNLWKVFKERGVSPEEEAIVCYVPFRQKGLMKFLSTVMPRLHVFIYPRGHLEEAYDPNFHPDDPRAWFKPIAEWRPKYWR